MCRSWAVTKLWTLLERLGARNKTNSSGTPSLNKEEEMQSRIKSIVILEIQNGMYAISTIDLILNAFINIWCVVFGVWIAVKRHGAVNG